MRRRRAIVALAAVGVLGRVALACIIDLESPVTSAGDAGLDGPASDGSVPPLPDVQDASATLDADADATACTRDDQCSAGTAMGSGCIKPVCRMGRCEFPFCPTSKCGVSRCDLSMGTGKCLDEDDAGFVVAALGAVSLNAACKDVARCVAVSHPLVFMANGPPNKPITAYNIGDYARLAPVEVVGLSMDPQFVVASGTRVYFIALPSAGASGNVGITIGWVDLPANPYVPQLVAQQVDLGFSGATLVGAFPGPESGLFLATNQAQLATVRPAPNDKGSIAAVRPSNLNTGAKFLAPTNDELAFAILNTANNVGAITAGILFNPGGASGAITSVGASQLGRVPTPQIFGAPGPGGSVVATFAVGDVDASSQAVVNVRSVKLVRLVAPGAQAVTIAPPIDVDVYQDASAEAGALAPNIRTIVAPAVVGDDVLTLSYRNGGTLAQVVFIDPDGGQPTRQARSLAMAAPLFTPASGPLQTVAATASGGFAYLFAATTDGGVALQLIKPGCDP